MAVGKEVFDTCVWIGRFIQQAEEIGKGYSYIYRKDEKMNICHSMKAKDSNIRQALIDRFGVVRNKEKSTVGFMDLKQIFGKHMQFGVTYLDMQKE